jgi:hypothetical protein
MNGVPNGAHRSTALAEDASSSQYGLRYARLRHDTCLSVLTMQTVHLLSVALEARPIEQWSQTRQDGLYLLLDLRRQGFDGAGPRIVADGARTGYDGHAFDHESTAAVIALRAGNG